MHPSAELTVLTIVCFALTAGAALSMLSKRLKVPYSIALLLLGIATPPLLHALPGSLPARATLDLLHQAGAISPHLILFIFLPVLVFESAFALEAHAFRRNLGAVMVLAGPALLISTFGSGAIVIGATTLLPGMTSWDWGWVAALVFGALISATDPVAVVSLLRSLGAPKRLSLLIEGESLLNDGTAIVVFTILLDLLRGHGELSASGALTRLVVVSGGGLLVGLVLAVAISLWLAQSFNEPLVEISLTLALAYVAMLIAEGVLHVSGVIAIVTAGLWMSGPGRVTISPEVIHFLHRFWEVLAHLANTLIFFLVGVVVASQMASIRAADILLIGVVYVCVMGLRFFLVRSARPAINLLCEGVSTKEANVMAWGGLRGAVSLALALMVAQESAIDVTLRRQLLLLTAGVVVLTIVVNGSTMAPLLRRFGFDRAPASDRLAVQGVQAAVLERVHRKLDAVVDAPDLRTVRWDDVREEIDQQLARLAKDTDATHNELVACSPLERSRGAWRQILSVERAAYWRAFGQGTLGAKATRVLDHEIDLQLDRLRAEDDTPPARRVVVLPGLIGSAERLLGAVVRRLGLMPIERIAQRYDNCRGEQLGAEAVLAWLDDSDALPDAIRARARATYEGYRQGAKEELERLRANLPELTQRIETRLAKRIRLNVEREAYKALEKEGVLDGATASAARSDIERRMKALQAERIAYRPPETAELVRNTPLFRDLDDDALAFLADATKERVLDAGDVMCAEGDAADSMFILARGAAGVFAGDAAERVAVIGGGDIVGEMALLSGEPRNATVRALTALTLGEVSRADFDALLERVPTLADRIRARAAAREVDNLERAAV